MSYQVMYPAADHTQDQTPAPDGIAYTPVPIRTMIVPDYQALLETLREGPRFFRMEDHAVMKALNISTLTHKLGKLSFKTVHIPQAGELVPVLRITFLEGVSPAKKNPKRKL